MAAQDLGTSEWERSKISNQDTNLMKKLGLMKKKEMLRFPSEESYPTPPIEYRVSFVDHLIRGLSTPIHDFLCGLLFVYGIQLHQLTPNFILHVSIFITLCECFLGVHPNWALWKRIFCLRRNGSHNIAYNIGGVVICVRPDVEYFDVKFPDSVQGWHRRWLYVRKECADSMEYNIAPFDGIRIQPLQARKNPPWKYSDEEDVDRLSKDLSVKDLEKLVRRISSLSKKDAVPSTCRVEPYSGTNALPKPLMKEFVRLGTQFIGYRDLANKLKESLSEANKHADDLARKLEQSEKTLEKAESDAAAVEGLRKRLHKAENVLRKTHQDYDMENPEGDRLLDALSLLEIHGDEARQGLADAKSGLSRLFPYFFAKKEEPETFTALAQHFIPEEDLGLRLRQEGLKIGVEGTIALVAESQQVVDWTKVGDVGKMETKKWQSMIKAAKPNSKKILSFLGCKPTPSPSTTKPEVK
ncbi:hypothetical protein QYE76_049785 [Lolium multiflorum]|uniref:Transposase (putative) gypsy type domain-containing protein n=1 Tax=Lolium multiflorum TaxID=4521 RepID=A0AAD8SQI5_LOLMU|nr:hypothetical protein QYE76_049785 [Lolium multiflorum]